ncbi:MAG: septal ring lytic transglycosylase RlpA family protein [Candidatus Aminicenantales bacterium]
MKKSFCLLKNFCLGMTLALLSSSCTRVNVLPPAAIQTGVASWYGEDFHGNPTSSREIYNMYDMTAAHPTLPFGTFVMVTNMTNGKSAIVRINDRGPFIKNIIIDLSYAAARLLDMVERGVVPVKVEVLHRFSEKNSSLEFSLQVGSFIDMKNAETLKEKLQNKYPGVYMSRFETSNQVYFRVRIKALTKEASLKMAQRLSAEGYKVLILEE